MTQHILVLHPVADYTLRRMLDACDRRGWELSIATIQSATIGENHPRLCRWLRVPELNDDPRDLLRSVEGVSVNAVVAGNEFAVVAADVLAKSLGLVGNDPRHMEAARDKRRMREAFAQAGVPQPNIIKTISSLEEARTVNWGEVQFPVIVKPVNMAMSLFVRLCATPEQALDNIDRMFAFTKSRLTNYKFTPQAIVEEFAQGPEYSLECIVENGDVIALYATQKFVSALPSCFETGHANAAPFAADIAHTLQGVAERVARSWQLANGVMHIELKLNAGHVKVIEAGCRIAGCHISELVEGRYGVSFEEVVLAQRLGLSVRQLVAVEPKDEFYGIKFFFPQSQQLHPADNALREVEFQHSPDQAVTGDDYSVNQRQGYNLVASKNQRLIGSFVISS